MSRPWALFLLVPAVVMPGCLERRLSITSEPPGAMVWVNDVELGRTPVEADFTFYGDYDVRVRLEGYEPIQRIMTASQPIYEYPPLDIAATVIPVNFDNVVKWHFDLQPTLESAQSPEEFRSGILERARRVREQVPRPGSDESTPTSTETAEPPPAETQSPESFTPSSPTEPGA